MKMNKRVSALGKKQVMANFPKRPRDSHKGMFG
jgi:NAD(P)H-hydrate repair Nnr-like enzyme with NAD(P)H-hydrate dehydratase domain